MKQFILTAAFAFAATICFSQKDSTKPAPAPKQYFIVGPDNYFKVLSKAVNSPGQLTRDEINGLNEWINKKQQIVTDTTQKKKPNG